MDVGLRSPAPGGIVVEVLAAVAVGPRGVVFALAHPAAAALGVHKVALGRVPVALAARPHGDVGDSVPVGLQHLLVVKHLVSEGVQAVEGDSDVGGCHPELGTKLMYSKKEQL